MRQGACFAGVGQLAIRRGHRHLLLVLTNRIGAGEGCQKGRVLHLVFSFLASFLRATCLIERASISVPLSVKAYTLEYGTESRGSLLASLSP